MTFQAAVDLLPGWARRGNRTTEYDLLLTALQARGVRTLDLRPVLRAAREAGLTPAQHQALLAIKGMPGPVTVGTLAGWLGVRHHSAVGLVDRLAALKLVARRPDPADRRRVRLALTPRADAKLATLSQIHRAELRRFSKALLAALR